MGSTPVLVESAILGATLWQAFLEAGKTGQGRACAAGKWFVAAKSIGAQTVGNQRVAVQMV
jgi:hypothetical protein